MNYELAEQLKEGRKANVLPRAAMSRKGRGYLANGRQNKVQLDIHRTP
jgi:hypothetical protein